MAVAGTRLDLSVLIRSLLYDRDQDMTTFHTQKLSCTADIQFVVVVKICRKGANGAKGQYHKHSLHIHLTQRKSSKKDNTLGHS
jgi:hypothetical protein